MDAPPVRIATGNWLVGHFLCHNNNTIWRESLEAGKFGKLTRFEHLTKETLVN